MGGQWQISMKKIRVRGGMFHFELNETILIEVYRNKKK